MLVPAVRAQVPVLVSVERVLVLVEVLLALGRGVAPRLPEEW